MRQQILLATLVGGMAIALYVQWPGVMGTLPAREASQPGGARTTGNRATQAPDVHLEALRANRPAPGAAERDLFKFRAKAAPPASRVPAPPLVLGPPPPPPVPPIPLKFIGVLEAAGPRRIAILSDGRGAPLYGKEGETVLGQYKILRVGNDSIEVEHIDGRGRQTIRLSGA
jgi:hypothetical protein